MPVIIDKRGYRPECIICFDEGCDFCIPTRATLLNSFSAFTEAQEFILKKYASREVKQPTNERELIELVLSAIEFGRSQSVSLASKESSPEATFNNRFNLIELDTHS